MRQKTNILCFLLIGSVFLMLPEGCTPSKKAQWEKDELITRAQAFNGQRYIFSSDSESSNIELEFLKTVSGEYFYVNFLKFRATCVAEDPCRSKLEIQFEGEEVWVVYPYILAGGQRLLFPEEDTQRLIQGMREGKKFFLRVGTEEIQVVAIKEISF